MCLWSASYWKRGFGKRFSKRKKQLIQKSRGKRLREENQSGGTCKMKLKNRHTSRSRDLDQRKNFKK